LNQLAITQSPELFDPYAIGDFHFPRSPAHRLLLESPDRPTGVPMILHHLDALFLILDFLGVFVGALGGAIAAIRDHRYKYDFIGVLGLAFASALGGGITRDVILQRGPPLAFLDIRYLVVAFAGAFDCLPWQARRAPSTQGSRDYRRCCSGL
jgi:Glycine transporter